MLFSGVYISKFFNLSACFSCILKHAKRYVKYVKVIKKDVFKASFHGSVLRKTNPPLHTELQHLARNS